MQLDGLAQIPHRFGKGPTLCHNWNFEALQLTFKEPLTRPATAGEGAAAVHPLPKGEGDDL